MPSIKKSIIKEKVKRYFEENVSGKILHKDFVIYDMVKFTKEILEEFEINTKKL